MKTHTLYLTVRVDVVSSLETLSQTIAEFEQDTDYRFTSTKNVQVTDTELLKTALFNT